jgi:hypothetical protein
MNWKVQAGIGLVAVGSLVGAALVVGKHCSGPPVSVTLRIAVNPGDQAAPVTSRANSAQFKCLVGKQAGVKPAMAQKLSVKAVLNSTFLEAHIGVLNQDEGWRYAEVFVETLQGLCGNHVQLALDQQLVR